MGGFGKPIHHRKDGVAIIRRDTSDKVQGYMGPGAMRNKGWLKEAGWSLLRSLILSTHHACGGECGEVRNHSGPPKMLSEERQDGRLDWRNEPIPGPGTGQNP